MKLLGYLMICDCCGKEEFISFCDNWFYDNSSFWQRVGGDQHICKDCSYTFQEKRKEKESGETK